MKRTVFLSLAVLAGLLAAAEVFHAVSLAPDGGNAWIVTIESTGVYHTPDFGSTWAPEHILTGRDFFGVYALDASRVWTCGRSGEIWHTSNGGDTWTRQNLAGPKYASRIAMLDSLYGWSSGGEAIALYTTNGGSQWRMFYLPETLFPNESIDFQGLSLCDRRHIWMAAGRYPEGDTFLGGQGYVFQLQDWGDSITYIFQRKDTTYDYFDVDFVDSLNGWIVGGDDRTGLAAVFRTTDGGTNWSPQVVPGGARLLRGVTFVNANEGWACGRNGTIIHTSDGGNSWELQNSGQDTTLFDVSFAGPLLGLIAGNSKILRTTDGGQHWEDCAPGIQDHGPAATRHSSFKVTPNPCRTAAWLRLQGPLIGTHQTALTVYDATGRLTLTLPVLTSPIQLPASALPPGIYILRLTGTSEAVTMIRAE
jgi:photosystem II stability/assembly factor-like uncharacterized protein